MARARGFTLIEIMITVAIIGILVAIAVPSYNGHLRKSRRAEAQGFMTQIAQKQQQYLLDARTYAMTLGELSMAAPASLTPWYSIAIAPGATTPSFTITATALADQVKDGNLTLTHTGAKQRIDPVLGAKDW